MGGVDLPFENLRPIAAHTHLRGTHTRVGCRREGGWLKFAHLVRRSEIRPDEAAGLARRIGLVFHALRHVGAGRFGSEVDDVALHVEFPAVIETAQPALFVAGEDKRGAAMRAQFVEHAEPALAVAEHDQVLAEQAHPQRRAIGFGHLLGEAGGDPVPAHDLAHRRRPFDTA